jgi:RNA polymerase sigma-70 factor, ECF subfamily
MPGLPDTYLMTHQSAARSYRVDDVDRHAQLEAWFRAYGDRVLAYLLHRTDRETAQDLLQEVFVTAFRKAPEVPDPPIGWLLGTARRMLANAARGDQRRDRLVLRVGREVPAAVVSTRGDDATGDVVARTLTELSVRDREVLTLSAWYELTADEAAQALGCSRSAYAVRLHRARHRFADRLRAAGYEYQRADCFPEAAHD